MPLTGRRPADGPCKWVRLLTMQPRDRRRLARWAFDLVVIVCLAMALVVVVQAVRTPDGLEAPSVQQLGLVLLGVLIVLALLAAAAWRRDSLAAGRLIEAERRARQLAEDAVDDARAHGEQEAERARREGEEEAERARRDAGSEREARERVERTSRTERDWTARLRREVAELHRSQGALGAGDVRELVLRIAVDLLDARRGLLLERGEGDGEESMRVACQVGFQHDPGHSAITRRLADRALRRDETLREDAAIGGDAAADAEIPNLVAIPVYVADELHGVVVCADRDGGFEEVDDEVLLALGDHAGAVLHSGRLQGELRSAYLATVSVLAGALEAKDPFLRTHSDEVAGYVAAVAEKVEVAPELREQLMFASLLHDVGKLGISERILLKAGPLTAEERAVIEQHPRIGFRLVEQVPALRPIAPAVLHHHERFDGGGYPTGLAGPDIPLEARIVCVADCFSAMTAERPYRGALSREEACEELVRGAGRQFDPDIVAVFVAEVRARADSPSPRALIEDAELLALRGNAGLLGDGAASLVDPVTLLFSHRHLLESADAEAGRAKLMHAPFEVLVAELADLEHINLEHGFAAGDRALREAAAAFEAAASAIPGALAARLGGRRLALLLPASENRPPVDPEANIGAALAAGPAVRLARAAWRTGDRGADVVGRARGAVRADAQPD